MPTEWAKLRDEASLSPGLATVLWGDLRAEAQVALVPLMVRFALAVPLRDGHLIPPLLKDTAEPDDGAVTGMMECYIQTSVFQCPTPPPPPSPPPGTRSSSAADPASLPGASARVDGGSSSSAGPPRPRVVVRNVGAGSGLLDYLPWGLFVRLLSKCVVWAESTSDVRGFSPELSRHGATLAFGGDVFRLRELPELNMIRVRLVSGTNPAPVVERLQDLMDVVIAECYPNLSFSLLIPTPTSPPPPPTTGAALTINTSTNLVLLDLDGVVQSIAEDKSVWVQQRAITANQLRDLCRPWLPPTGLLPEYDVFLSYRWVRPACCCCTCTFTILHWCVVIPIPHP